MPVDREFIDEYVEEEKDPKMTTMSVTFNVTPEERDMVEECIKQSGAQKRLFVRHFLLEHCRFKRRMREAEKKIEEKFMEDFVALKREGLEKRHKFEERREQMLQLAAQDEGGDPFDEEDLVE